MDITITNNEMRFGCRVAAIIYNKDMSKILVQRIKDIYMFPGGRMHTLEDSKTAIIRELKEELNISEPVNLKYTAENIIILPNEQRYHEIGYYYLLKVDEEKYGLSKKKILNKDFKNDGNIYFEWVNVKEIGNYKIIPKIVADKIKGNNLFDLKLEHIIYKEF